MKRMYAVAVCGLLAVSGFAAAEPATITNAVSSMDPTSPIQLRASEAIPIGNYHDWERHTKIVQYTPYRQSLVDIGWGHYIPEWCEKILTWYQAFEAYGNTATNTRVQVRNLELYILDARTDEWVHTDSTRKPIADKWKRPFEQVDLAPGDRDEPEGGHSVKPVYPHFFHGYGNDRTLYTPDPDPFPDSVLPPEPWFVKAVYVSMEFRLVVDDDTKPSDIAQARYVVNVGADYWPGYGKPSGWPYAPGIGNGRLLLATDKWRTATMLVPNKQISSFADMLANPPPPLRPAP